MDLNAYTAPLNCLSCGKQFDANIGEMRSNPHLPCPHCGTRFDLREMDEAFLRLEQSLGKLGIAARGSGKRT